MAGGSFQLPKSAPSEIRTPVTGHLAFFWGDGTEGTSEGLFYSMDDARTVVEIGGETLTTEQVIDAVAAAIIASDTIDITYDDAEGEITIEVKDASITTDMLAFDPATQTELGAHITDTTDAHAASAIGVTPFGTIAATTVQAALEEIVDEVGLGSIEAEDVGFTPAGGITASDVQAAIEEVAALVGGGGYTDEMAQDAVGSILVDSATIDFTYTDGTPSITASVKTGSVSAAMLDFDPATQAELDAGLSQNSQTGTTYTLVLGDANKVVECSNASAITLTVPTNASVAFPTGTVIEVAQMGAGQVTVAAAGGVTIRAFTGSKTAGQYASVGLRKRDTNEWVLTGGVA